MKAIETEYKGCLFRSRLEARWAVFFDAMRIKWEYEPQGYELGWRLSNCPDHPECGSAPGDWCEGHPISYLPDFWLPELELFAEVKGAMDERELLRTINAIASMGANYHTENTLQNDFLFLGPIPSDPNVRPWRLHMHKGTLYVGAWKIGEGSPCGWGDPLAYDVGGKWSDISAISDWSGLQIPARAIRFLLSGGSADPFATAPIDDRFRRAYRAARSARFEHGQSGAQLF